MFEISKTVLRPKKKSKFGKFGNIVQNQNLLSNAFCFQLQRTKANSVWCFIMEGPKVQRWFLSVFTHMEGKRAWNDQGVVWDMERKWLIFFSDDDLTSVFEDEQSLWEDFLVEGENDVKTTQQNSVTKEKAMGSSMLQNHSINPFLNPQVYYDHNVEQGLKLKFEKMFTKEFYEPKESCIWYKEQERCKVQGSWKVDSNKTKVTCYSFV